jgi:S-adenosylmethionine-diacylgycerolhomoserine-N-methlytransferase
MSTIKNDIHPIDVNNRMNSNMTLFDWISCYWKIVSFPLKGNKIKEQQESLDAFYNEQKQFYNEVRETMLPVRPNLISCMGPISTNSTWIDFCGGTGRNIAYIEHCLDRFEKIVLVDLCEPLLNMATETFSEHIQSNKLVLIKKDVTTYNFCDHIREKTGVKTFDFVTVSYGLTMIPNWKKQLKICFN